jgi:hypothetical protein
MHKQLLQSTITELEFILSNVTLTYEKALEINEKIEQLKTQVEAITETVSIQATDNIIETEEATQKPKIPNFNRVYGRTTGYTVWTRDFITIGDKASTPTDRNNIFLGSRRPKKPVGSQNYEDYFWNFGCVNDQFHELDIDRDSRNHNGVIHLVASTAKKLKNAADVFTALNYYENFYAPYDQLDNHNPGFDATKEQWKDYDDLKENINSKIAKTIASFYKK